MFISCANNKGYFENTYNSEYRGQIVKIHKDEMNHNSTYFDFKLPNNELSNIIADAFHTLQKPAVSIPKKIFYTKKKS